jgi:hypothetical protein
VTVGIADVAALLVRVLFRRSQEFSTPGAPGGVHGVDVFDPDIEEAADPIQITRCLQDDRGLVIGWAAADIDDDPAVRAPANARPCRRPAGEGAAGEAAGTGMPGSKLSLLRSRELLVALVLVVVVQSGG